MREGIEKLLFDKFCELLHQHEKPIYALHHLDWLVFVEHKDEFFALSEEEQMEVRMYIEAIVKVHGR